MMPPFQNHPLPLLGSPPLLKISHSPTGKSVIPSFPYQQKFNCEVKFNNTVYVRKQHKVGFLIFKFTLSI